MGVRKILFTTLTLSLVAAHAYAASLDDVYGTQIQPRQLLTNTQFNTFYSREKGIHGSASFSGFEAAPKTYSVTNELIFSLAPKTQTSLRYTQDLPSHYDRATKNNADVVSSFQSYHVKSGQTLSFTQAFRSDHSQVIFDVRRTQRNTDWRYAPSRDSAQSIVNYLESDYSHLNLSWQGLSESTDQELKALDIIDRPLLDAGQINAETSVSLDTGRLTRDRRFYHPTASQYQHYLFRTAAHITPSWLLRYGAGEQVELETGVGFKTPFKYKYRFSLYNQNGTNQNIEGTYRYKNWIEMPLGLRYRPKEGIEWRIRCDTLFVNQKLDYWQKSTTNTLTNYPQKKLQYYQVEPAIGFSYLGGAETTTDPTRNILKEKLLRQDQFLWSADWHQNVSVLRKNSSSGTQNFLDPYDAYQYPAELFREGTEYAAFLSGNSATTPSQIAPQNYHEFRAGYRHGFSDTLNAGVKVGYRTRSAVHQFALNDSADVAERSFKFSPFVFFDVECDWLLFEHALFSTRIHFVPEYNTRMRSTVQPEEFEDHTRYLNASAGIKVLF